MKEECKARGENESSLEEVCKKMVEGFSFVHASGEKGGEIKR